MVLRYSPPFTHRLARAVIVTVLHAPSQLNGEMLSANARIAVRHAWESYWYEWPLNLRGLLYYSKNVDDPDKTNTVYLLGACRAANRITQQLLVVSSPL